MWLDIYRSNSFISRECRQTYLGISKAMPNVGQLHLKNELIYKMFIFGMWLGIQKSYILVTSECGQVCPKWLKATSWLYFKSELRHNVRSSHRKCSSRKVVPGNFTKFTGKHLCLSPATLLKKILWHSCFPVSFAKVLRTSFLQNISGRPPLNCFKKWLVRPSGRNPFQD